uniref:Secreted protein n=1 Tax=Nothobranchius furzeri TaxID=105023 RepID=A0A1A8B7B7_NOTFU
MRLPVLRFVCFPCFSAILVLTCPIPPTHSGSSRPLRPHSSSRKLPGSTLPASHAAHLRPSALHCSPASLGKFGLLFPRAQLPVIFSVSQPSCSARPDLPFSRAPKTARKP